MIEKKEKKKNGISIRQKIVYIDLDKLILDEDNPKDPLGKKYEVGLDTSIKTFGMLGAFIVAPSLEKKGFYHVCDGKSRVEKLIKEKKKTAPCIIIPALSDPDKRRQFILSYDRHKKLFDEVKVAEQVLGQKAKGHDKNFLQRLTGIDDLDSFAEKYNPNKENGKIKEMHVPPTREAILMIMGPEDIVENIERTIKAIKGKMGRAEKFMIALRHAEVNINFTDSQIVAVALDVLRRFGEKVLPDSKIFQFASTQKREEAEELVKDLLYSGVKRGKRQRVKENAKG